MTKKQIKLEKLFGETLSGMNEVKNILTVINDQGYFNRRVKSGLTEKEYDEKVNQYFSGIQIMYTRLSAALHVIQEKKKVKEYERVLDFMMRKIYDKVEEIENEN